jgi:hypothetical protein
MLKEDMFSITFYKGKSSDFVPIWSIAVIMSLFFKRMA